jgi:lipoyl synthase
LIRKPEWLKTQIPSGDDYFRLSHLIKSKKLNTVCKEAKCPNIGECWEHGRATFMILGDICTRSCRFCNVRHGAPNAVDLDEPKRILESIKIMKIEHVVITSVTRDDLPDQGANQFADVVRILKSEIPEISIEVMIPDMKGKSELIDIILEAEPDVLNHNTETVKRLSKQIRSGADYERSLGVLKYASSWKKKVRVKSGFMVGMGEKDEEVIELIDDLKEAGCNIITIGQYLQPSKENIPVARYVEPEKFKSWKLYAEKIGIERAFAGPLVRSSYRADEQIQNI